jgi:hypothetical protein
MTTSNLLGYFIIASGIAIVFTLLGIVYEMHKSKCTYTRTAPSPPEHLRPCNHQFPIHEPITNENPKCIKCGKKFNVVNNNS